MKTKILLFILLISVGVFPKFSVLFAQDSSKTNGARIFVEERSYDFGQVSEDTLLSHSFVFHNIGNDTLRVLRLKSG